MLKPLIRTTGCVFALATALGCWGKTGDRTQVGGETNWLLSCNSSADCAIGSCLCNVCTVECDTVDGCGNGPPGSSCVTIGGLGKDCSTVLTSSAPSAGLCLAPRGDVGPASPLDATLGEIAQDLAQHSAADRPFLRYLSLQNLANVDPHPVWTDGNSPAEIIANRTARGRLALAKLINSLSAQPEPARSTSVGSTGRLASIDLRDLGWDRPIRVDEIEYPDPWAAIVAHAQLGVEYQGIVADRIQEQTGTRVPLLFADDFVAAASVGDVYYEILGMPDTLRTLEELLLPDRSTTAEAVFSSSGVSIGARIVQRQSFSDAQRPYWKALDFDASISVEALLAGAGDIGPGSAEVIYRLPNGFQAFFLSDADGRRVGISPLSPQIVSDPAQPDKVLRNSASCYGCHNAGLISFADQLHPKDTTLQLAVDADSAFYMNSAESAGIPNATPDAIGRIFVDFGRDVLPGRAALELFVTPEVLAAQTARLPYPLRVLGNDAGSVSRNTFSSRYLEALCALQSGAENQPVGCP